MKPFLSIAFALVAVSATAMPQRVADREATNADLKCLVVSAVAAGSSDPTVSKGGTIAAVCWIGRIDGQDPNYDLEGAIVALAQSMKPDDFRSEGQRCGAILQARGKALQDLGARLQGIVSEPPKAS